MSRTVKTVGFGSVVIIIAFLSVILQQMTEHGILSQQEGRELGAILSLWFLAVGAVAISEFLEWFEEAIEVPWPKLWYAYGALVFLINTHAVLRLEHLNPHPEWVLKSLVAILVGLIASWPIVVDAWEDAYDQLDGRFEGGLS